jgi:cytochrome c peroxidase
MKKEFLYVFFAVALVSCGESETKEVAATQPETAPVTSKYEALDEQARTFFGSLPEVAENPNNPLTAEKVLLGKTLYFDNRLSKDNTQSCNTCHNLNTYGVDNNSFSEGNDGGLGGRNSPTTLNAALHISQFWDGREPDVEAQAGGPILNPVEMAMPSEEAVVERLSDIDEYIDLFDAAFPEAEEAITYNNLKLAIGAFERKLITPSAFDNYIAGDDNAFTDAEKDGLQTFVSSGCVTCHAGALLGGAMYQKFGVYGDYWEMTKSEKVDNGRFDVTGNEVDKYQFKVPSLRNIAKTGPYFHDGSVADLKDAIRIMAKLQVNKDLTDDEVASIEVFLNSLTGEVSSDLKQ